MASSFASLDSIDSVLLLFPSTFGFLREFEYAPFMPGIGFGAESISVIHSSCTEVGSVLLDSVVVVVCVRFLETGFEESNTLNKSSPSSVTLLNISIFK